MTYRPRDPARAVGSAFFVPAVPRDTPCQRCGIYAYHAVIRDCLRECKAERDVLLERLKARERTGGVVLVCPWCAGKMIQTKVAQNYGPSILKRVYRCHNCHTYYVTDETIAISSLYRSAGLPRPPSKGGENRVLPWDEKIRTALLGSWDEEEPGESDDGSSDPPEGKA